MGITLGRLTLDPVAPSDIARGDAGRAVNADGIAVDIGSWRRSYDGIAAPFLLSGLYGAILAAVRDGQVFHFFCLDDPDGGRVFPATSGYVRVRLKNGEEHELYAFEVMKAVFAAMAEVAEFLTESGYPEGSLILLRELTQRAPSDRAGWEAA